MWRGSRCQTLEKPVLQVKQAVIILRKLFGSNLALIILLALLVLAGTLWPFDPIARLESRHYDFWSGHFSDPGDVPVAIVAIDDKSLEQIGDWPWPRTLMAKMIRHLSAAGADSLGICPLYSHPAINPGLQAIEALRAQIAEPSWRGGKKTTQRVDQLLTETARNLDQDAHLISAVRSAKNAVLPLKFSAQPSSQEDTGEPSGLLIINSIKAPETRAASPPPLTEIGSIFNRQFTGLNTVTDVREPFGELARKAGALGHLNLYPDPDGIVRAVPLLIQYQGRLCPALSLQVAIKHLRGRIKDITLELGDAGSNRLGFKQLRLPTDDDYRMLLNFRPEWTAARTYSFVDVLNETVAPDTFRDKIVFIGVTARGETPFYQTAAAGDVGIVEISANLLAAILAPRQLARPYWAWLLEIGSLLYFGFFLVFVIPRVNLRVGALILGIFLVTWYAAVAGLLVAYGFRIHVWGPIILTICGFGLIGLRSFAFEKQADQQELNKTLGLSFQGQGMLDMAYEKYMQCSIRDASVKNLMYNLALDFERKRMFNKALAIYQHLATAGRFKDVGKRIKKLKHVGEPLSFASGSGRSDPTLLIDDSQAKPTFGRYEILKELGRGAMGTVYLGRDPTINREVAIKTMEYAEIEERELPDVKARFFREAEAAGKLSHPNIVSIYDAGEEHDMAYIAMELLIGEDLTQHCHGPDLLPIPRTLEIVAAVAEALDYAHLQGVVHRDIKPANIMLLEDGQVKVTDFGIARVIASSQTRTGIILGTPSYMSPEQVAGKKVDGRSDLFSLGIVLYELLAGAKPFKGDSITAIMYSITHNAPTPLGETAPHAPECCVQLVDKLLTKGLTRRFATAARASTAITACLTEFK